MACRLNVRSFNLLGLVFLASSFVFAQDIWVTGYYAGWMQGWENYGRLPAEEIDYSAVTHIIHFGLVPKVDGTIDSLSNSMTEVNSRELLRRAREAGKKVLITVGGWGTDAAFRQATNPLNINRFIDNLIDFMRRRGYDGIDVDWEYLDPLDEAQYVLFIQLLRSKLDLLTPQPLLTAAVAWQPSIIALVADHFDQINVMTYDLSGAWPGWVTWHNSPVFDGGFRFPSTLRPVPSADGMIQDFLNAGIPPRKLGIGIDFYGYIWRGGIGTPTGGVTEPRQSWTSPPSVQPNVPYYQIKRQEYHPRFYRWDSLAHAPYLSIDDPNPANDRFISYCDERSCEAKVAYARSKGLGGVFIWELGGGYMPASFQQRDRLLQAIKHTVAGTVLAPEAPYLKSPANGARGVPVHTNLRWYPSYQVDTYRLQISLDSLFTTLVIDTILMDPWFSLDMLERNTQYYWKVLAANGGVQVRFHLIGRSERPITIPFTRLRMRARKDLPYIKISPTHLTRRPRSYSICPYRNTSDWRFTQHWEAESKRW
ncbi:MAG TPA: glycoside hydrolase family 18 protein [Bacteroidota bacterium]|nr:glycoside hydrolase family 18 protein [Bacteroidota bacterium]